MAAENESPSKEPSTRGRGRGGRGGRRGRGGGRGASNSASVSKAAASSRGGRGGSRRGRAKTFSDSRVQAAYERQRDLKAVYQAVAHALKPALQELAERSIDELLQQPTIHKQAAEYAPIVKQLRQNLEERIAQHTRRLQSDLQLAENTFTAEKYVADQEFQNGVEDVLEEFWEAQQNRFRILHALHKKELPVDVRDDQYEYKVITDTELDRDFNIYECYKYGKLVPYPSRVRGTEMWRRAREADAAAATNAAAAAASASVSGTSAPAGRGRGRGRGVNKRRAAEQPDGQPTPKRSTRGMDDTQLFAPSPLTPAPSKGLLASAAESHLEEGGDEESVPASPEPPNLTNGSSSSTNAQGQEPLSARDRSPPLPKNAGEPDDYGVRVYSQRPAMRDKGMNSRVVAPPLFKFDEWDIGFRDSSNDSTRGHTRAKRCKYLDKPNSNAMHFDHWCNGYDFSSMDPEELDEDLIKKHRVHPKWGIFLPDSQNDQEQGDPYVMPGRPVVFIANPSGRLSHTSRSFQATINHRNVDDAPWRGKMGSSLLRFCKLDDVDLEDISVTDYLPTDEEWRAKSLKTAMKELKGRPEFKEAIETEESTPKEETPAETEDAKPQLSLLTYAAAYIEASNTPRPVPATPKQSRYDAIRDVFTDAKPTPAPPAAPEPDRVALNFLAELCNIENRLPVPAGSTAPYEVPPQPMPAVAPYQEPVPLDSYVRGPPHAEQEVPPPVYGQQSRPAAEMPIDNSYSYAPIQHSGPVPIQAAPPARGLSSEPPSYRPYHEQPHLAPAPPPPAGPPHVQEYAPYPPPAGYAYGEPREVQMAPSRAMEGGYAMHGGPGGYPPEPPSYPPSIWAQHGTPAPPPPPPQSMPHGHAPPPSHYASRQPPPPSQSRMSFSQNGSAEPLPPLRPPRAASTQPMPEEPMHDPGMHQPARASTGGFYPLAPSRPYGVDSRPPLQPIATDRILPSPQQAGHGYMTSPQQQQGYGQSIMSPTYGNQPMGPGAPQVVQSPPGTPQGPPGSAHRHRSTPSGSSDAGSNKYRKLQPAPIPAHRAGWSKQELKTIPYDVKDMGNSAALPSSGPTQIRGWNVNQHRKRGKAEKQDKSEPAADRDDAR